VRLLYAVTEFGDAALLLPLAALVLVWLLLRRSRLAAWWAVAVALCVGLTAAAKIYSYGCPPVSDIKSPSGHTAFSILIYGALAAIAAAPGGGPRRIAAIGIGAGLIAAIAISRLLLSIHTLPEIVCGVMIGAASLAVFVTRYVRSPQPKVWPLLLTIGLVMILLHGQELHAEELLHRITGYLQIRCR
jgi:uncharacterized protein (TIGR03382 family)